MLQVYVYLSMKIEHSGDLVSIFDLRRIAKSYAHKRLSEPLAERVHVFADGTVIVASLEKRIAASSAQPLRVFPHQTAKPCVILGIQKAAPIVDTLVE